MLTGKRIAFIGGDARQVEMIKKCSDLDASVYLIGYEDFQENYTGVFKTTLCNVNWQRLDVIILPVSGTDEDGGVESHFSLHTLVLKEEHVQQLPAHCVIYTGIAQDYLIHLTSKYNIQLTPLLDRNDVAIYNSIPTVEGAIMKVIQNTDITIHGSNVIVLGPGRTGISLARAFKALGAAVKVGARKKEDLARAYEMGMKPFHIQHLKQEVEQCDVLLNTVPSLIVKANIIAEMPTDTYILDLASHPGGVDFRFAQKRGIKAELVPGLPGIVAPKTAGQIMASVVTQLMIESHTRRDEDGS